MMALMRRRIDGFLAALLVMPVAAVAIGGTPAHAAAPSVSCLSVAGDDDAAAVMAKACGVRVAVESARTEYTETFAEPGGGQSMEVSVVPQRAKRLDGSWGAIDTGLRRIGGGWAPVAAASAVRFSDGGSGPFATMSHQGHTFTMSWPDPLPAPVVSADSATYREVLPDTDLVVRATDTGFSHLLVVKSARAAADPRVRQTRYTLGGTATLKSTVEGGLVAEAGGVLVATADEALMWDSTPQRRYGKVAAQVTGNELVLTPEADLLANGQYPISVDPLFVTGQNQWAYATSTNENGPTTDGKIAAGDPSPAAPALRVGNDPGTSRTYRSFLRFPIGTVAHKQVLTAKISGRVDHTWKCTDNRPNYFYRTAGISATPRQAWPGPALQLKLGNNSVHANEDSCTDPNDPFEVSTSTLISDLQTSANNGAANYYVGISAGESTGGTNESNQERWMRYFTNDFRLHITYNTKPNKPDTLTVDGKACASGANRPFIKTTTPTLRARVTDADNDTMDVYFAWAKWNGTSFVDEAGSGWHQDSVPNGGTALKTVTGVDGGIYTFRAQSNDSPSHSPYLSSDVTHSPGNCEWEVDIMPPAAPTVTPDIYKEGPTGCTGGACGAVGQTGRFTFASSADTKSFLWGWSDPPATVANPTTLGGTVSLDWTPTTAGPHTLYVRAIDRAGNESNKAYQFYVAAPTIPVSRWLLNEPAGATALVDDTGHGNTAWLVGGATAGAPGRLAPGNDGFSRTVLSFDGVDDRAETTGPVIADTSKSFSVAAFVKLGDTSARHSAVSQAGSVNGAFWLEFNNGAWQFTLSSADTTTPTLWTATGTSVPRPDTWTHLAGTYDSASKTLRLYVNGVLEGTATGATGWDANGVFRMGGASAPWKGSLEGVRAWDRVILDSEVPGLVDPTRIGKVAEWRLEEVGPGPAFDGSGFAHDLTFFNGAQIPPSGAGQTGTGLRLDGVDDYVATGETVINTDQSFTVSAWVRMSDTTKYQTILSQATSATNPGFMLYFSSSTDMGLEWKFKIYASGTADNTVSTLAATPAATPTAYHHLVGVFDAQKREIRLYVDGALKATVAMNAAWQPWHANGPFLIGRTHEGANPALPAKADIDEVRVYQGVVTDVTRIP